MHMKNLFFKATLTAVLLFSGLAALAQNISVKGTVNDLDGQPIIGAGVLVEGTTNGVITDIDGNYTISVPANGALVFSALGYEAQTVAVNGKAVINVVLTESAMSLEGTVVTALGIKRAAKTIGYAATEVKTSELLTANAVSPVASLQGKVAGVEINQSDGGLFGSTKIQIRGASTLSKNNQPIYVIDGVILDNAISNTGDADWDSNINDYGNQLKNLNPDDFESLTVLKGAAATALYGSRGLNGAVVITTKSGRGTNGIGVSFSQTVGFDYVYDTPGLQSDYLTGIPNGFAAWQGWPLYGDAYAESGNPWENNYGYARNSSGMYSILEQFDWGYGWGAPLRMFKGQQAELFDGTIGTIQTYPDRYKDAFKTGFNTNTNISISGGNDKTSFYASASYKYAEGTTQNNTFDRTSFFVKAGHHITDKLIVDASFNFTTSTPRNAQLNIGEYFGGGEFPAEYDTKYYKDKYKGLHGGLASGAYGDAYRNVPGKGLWWTINENDYTQKETTIRPTIEVTYNAFSWLNFKVGGNYNYYLIRGENKQRGSGYANDGGYYALSQDTTTQLNFYYGANAQYQVNDDLEIHGFVRGEYFDQGSQYNSVNTVDGLIVPNQFFIGNSKKTPNASGRIYNTKRIASAIAAFGLGWRDQLFLDVTGRNDWSSSLVYTNGTGNYSYFYPSVSGSWLVTETFKDQLPQWITFAKVRASLAQVGNDTSPYYINSGYTVHNSTFNGPIYSLEIASQIKSPNLKPEKKTSWEVGIDWRFFNNRVGIDATYYKENTRNQIMAISVPYVSGISTELVNAGNIQNAGFEIALNTTPIETKDWRWDVDFTYTRNRNKIISLHEDVANYIKLDGDPDYGNYRIGSVAKVGGAYGLLMTDSKPKIDEATGLPILNYFGTGETVYYPRSGVVEELGSMLPDFLGSLNTTLRYKNLAVRASFDARFGGYVASYNSRYALSYGFSETSLKYREGIEWTSKYAKRAGITYYDGFIPEGVFTGNITVNGQTIDAAGKTYRELYEAGILEPAHMTMTTYLANSWGNGVVNDDWVSKLNYIALREITLSYTLPSKWASVIKARNLSVSATGRNLGYLLNTAPNHENPESVRGTGASNFRMRSFSPYTRSFLFTINASF